MKKFIIQYYILYFQHGTVNNVEKRKVWFHSAEIATFLYFVTVHIPSIRPLQQTTSSRIVVSQLAQLCAYVRMFVLLYFLLPKLPLHGTKISRISITFLDAPILYTLGLITLLDPYLFKSCGYGSLTNLNTKQPPMF